MFTKALIVCLMLWAILFGIFSVTNLEVQWGRPIMGFSALALGICCLIVLIKKDKVE